MQAGSVLTVSGVTESVDIVGELLGNVLVQGDLLNRMAISGAEESTGDILVHGDIMRLWG